MLPLAAGLAIAAAAAGTAHVSAAEAPPAAADPVLEAQVVKLSAELRCLVCQNQTIADSNAPLAVDLRNQVRDMLRRGDRPEQVIEFMTARYGDFVLYRPPVKGTTFLLWFGPIEGHPTLGSKANTTLQIIVVVVALLNATAPFVPAALAFGLTLVTLVTTVISGVGYIGRSMRVAWTLPPTTRSSS